MLCDDIDPTFMPISVNHVWEMIFPNSEARDSMKIVGQGGSEKGEGYVFFLFAEWRVL